MLLSKGDDDSSGFSIVRNSVLAYIYDQLLLSALICLSTHKFYWLLKWRYMVSRPGALKC